MNDPYLKFNRSLEIETRFEKKNEFKFLYNYSRSNEKCMLLDFPITRSKFNFHSFSSEKNACKATFTCTYFFK